MSQEGEENSTLSTYDQAAARLVKNLSCPSTVFSLLVLIKETTALLFTLSDNISYIETSRASNSDMARLILNLIQ